MQWAASLLCTLWITTSLLAQVNSTQPLTPAPAKAFPKLPYTPPTSKERMEWYLSNTVGVASLGVGVLSAGWSTLSNQPVEYGPHWDGFGKRYGIRLSVLATSNAMEAGLGALWGEDPRYDRVGSGPFKSRVRHVMTMTVLSNNREGNRMPAYARFAAVPGSSFLSSTWRADSDATLDQAVVQSALGFLTRMGGNAWEEFWPDTKRRIFRRRPRTTTP